VLQAVTRWIRYNLVGMMGFAVQTLTLTFLLAWTGLPDLAALALAWSSPSPQLLWHERVTWPDRPREDASSASHASSSRPAPVDPLELGLTKIVMLLTGMPILASNVLAVASASFVQFLSNDRVVFKA